MTGQYGENMVYGSNRTEITQTPLDSYFQRKGIDPKFHAPHTALWRGYIGSWEIAEGKLYLVGLDGQTEEVTTVGDCLHINVQDVSMDTFFPNQQGRVFADWYTGEISIPQGKLLEHLSDEYCSVYESEMLLDIRNGVVVQSRVKHHGDGQLQQAAPSSWSPPEPSPSLPVQKNVTWEKILMALGDRAAYFEMQRLVAEGSEFSPKAMEEMEEGARRSMSVIAGGGPAMVTHQAIALTREAALVGARRKYVQACLASLSSLIEAGVALPLAAYRQDRLSKTVPELEMPRRRFPALRKQARINAFLDDWQAIAEASEVQRLIADTLDRNASPWRPENVPLLMRHIEVTQARLDALRDPGQISGVIAHRLAMASRLHQDMRVDALSSMQSAWRRKYFG